MKIYKAAIFDMDGTLVDTLDDLRDSVNEMLARYNLPPRTRDEVRRFVGNGARNFEPPPVVYFIANRPFLFVIRDVRSGVTLFAGVVNSL